MNSNQARLRALVDQHILLVRRVLLNLGVSSADVDDAVQRTFIVVADKLERIEVGAERRFLIQSAKYIALHARRSALRRPGGVELDESMPAQGEGPDELLSQKQSRVALNAILDRMPEDIRVVFVLYEFEQLTSPEIADLLGIPLGTVASRLRRARDDFRARVQRLDAALAAGRRSASS